MNLDEELRTTFASESGRLEPPDVDAHDILARGKLRRRRRRTTVQAGTAAAVLAVIAMGAFGLTRADRTSTLPAIPTPDPTAAVPTASTLLTWDCGASQCLTAGTYRVGLGTGDDSKFLHGELQVPWSDWASDGYLHRVWKESGAGSVALNVYEPKALAGPQPCDAEKTVDLGPDPTANDVAGRLSDLPQFTVVQEPRVAPAFGRETIHLRIQADRLRCGPAAGGDQYQLAAIHGGDGSGTWEDELLPAVPLGASTVDPGRRVVIDLWVVALDGQNIVVEARQEGSPTATTVTQLDKVRQSVRFVAE